MSGEEGAGLPATAAAAPLVAAEEATAQKRAGWVKSADGRFHEVEDIDLVVQAYPGQYEEVKASEVKKTMVGWPSTEEG